MDNILIEIVGNVLRVLLKHVWVFLFMLPYTAMLAITMVGLAAWLKSRFTY